MEKMLSISNIFKEGKIVKKEILDLREKMKENAIDVYYVPSGDYHSSEYVNDFFKCREFMTNLTGEAGELIVNDEGAYLWTDARYFLQAENQLAGTEIELMRMAEPGVPTIEEFLEEYASRHKGCVLGFYGKVLPAATGLALEEKLAKYDVTIKYDKDLVDEVWTDRPEFKATKLFELPFESVGVSSEEKVRLTREEMKAKGADYVLLTDLMETAWLFNMRARDIAYTPVFFGYTLIGLDDVRLFVLDGAVDGKLPASLDFVKLEKYEDIDNALAEIPADKKLWINMNSANYELAKVCQKVADGKNLIEGMNPVTFEKVIKNESEIKSSINAHIKDGVAMVKFISWLKNNVGKTKLTEIDAAEYLEARRFEQEGCFDISFETISGYGPNGAIVHYAPTEETNLEIKPEGLLLMDSGGQYMDGTTDITRTIAVGPLTQEMIDNYTYVLKSHLVMILMDVPKDMDGVELDTAIRQPMRDVGMDFKHGLSHGVGHVLSVHEGPNILRRIPTPIELKPGMIMSDEPGFYVDGEYGIRIENELLFVDKGNGDMRLQNITFCPYEREAINKDLLSEEELAWVNNYHKEVREILEPLVDDETKKYLIEATAEI